MKITIEPIENGAEEEIIIRCNNLDKDIMDLVYAVKNGRSRLTAYSSDNGIVKLSPEQILYFEAVDNKVFACCAKQVYEVKQKLYELEQLYEHSDLLRISKAMIVNVSAIERIVPAINGRLDAILSNGEKVVISRQYVPDLKKKLCV